MTGFPLGEYAPPRQRACLCICSAVGSRALWSSVADACTPAEIVLRSTTAGSNVTVGRSVQGSIPACGFCLRNGRTRPTVLVTPQGRATGMDGYCWELDTTGPVYMSYEHRAFVCKDCEARGVRLPAAAPSATIAEADETRSK